MCSGKTHELLKAATLLSPNFKQTLVVKHSIDSRSTLWAGAVASRTGLSLPATHTLSSLEGLPAQGKTLYVVDEAQFFPAASLLALFSRLERTSTLLAAGLDLCFQRLEFGGTLALARVARGLPGGEGSALLLSARCCAPGCGAPAPFTQRLSSGGASTVLVGGAEHYRPACAAHHTPAPIAGEGWARE